MRNTHSCLLQLLGEVLVGPVNEPGSSVLCLLVNFPSTTAWTCPSIESNTIAVVPCGTDELQCFLHDLGHLGTCVRLRHDSPSFSVIACTVGYGHDC